MSNSFKSPFLDDIKTTGINKLGYTETNKNFSNIVNLMKSFDDLETSFINKKNKKLVICPSCKKKFYNNNGKVPKHNSWSYIDNNIGKTCKGSYDYQKSGNFKDLNYSNNIYLSSINYIVGNDYLIDFSQPELKSYNLSLLGIVQTKLISVIERTHLNNINEIHSKEFLLKFSNINQLINPYSLKEDKSIIIIHEKNI